MHWSVYYDSTQYNFSGNLKTVLGFTYRSPLGSFINPHLRANSLYNLTSIIMTVVIIHRSQEQYPNYTFYCFTCDMRVIQIVDDNYVDFQQFAN